MLTGRSERTKDPAISYGYNIKRLIGKTLKSAVADVFCEAAVFIDSDGVTYILGRSNDRRDGYEYGESEISDVVGDIDDLIGSPIIIAEEVKSEYQNQDKTDQLLWTFYRIGTRKGTVTIRFNDYADMCEYYSVWVDFHVIPAPSYSMPMNDGDYGHIVCERAQREAEARERSPWPRVGDVVLESPVGTGVIDSMNGHLPRVNGICCAWVVTERGGLYDPGGYKTKLVEIPAIRETTNTHNKT